MYITLTAAFQSEEQPDFESLGITPSEEDFEDVFWDDLDIMYDGIAAMNENSAGNTNIYLFNGQKWTVKEPREQIKRLCMEVARSLPENVNRISNK